MLTLFRMATLSGWNQLFSINFYGCDVYNGGVYYEAAEPESQRGL